MPPIPIALGPTQERQLVDAIERGSGVLADIDAARGLVWATGPDGFPDPLPPGVEWVQLYAAGVEEFFTTGIIGRNPKVQFTSAAGAFANTVAEHTLALLLAGVRYLPEQILATTWRQPEFFPHIGTLRNSTVAIIGAGGIGRALIPMLAAVGAHVLAVSRSGRPVPGAVETLPVIRLDEVWARTDHVVIAAPATPATKHIVGADELAQLKPTSWLINIARGSLVDTDALVKALQNNIIGGAGLDVTEPEPLPDDHPLWSLPNAIVTPHLSNPPQRRVEAFAERVSANVARFAAGNELLSKVDPVSGY
ncbi:D-isomer specific 2-hydroxyacid dehydrogenase family protein [Antrihabitans sp. YC2-6]|uniref:D-isomer specific 2-hydroxyacid dehydrogenase family protein n=1 Tax=Antrihabitans sp. YC2-6 TaxID=2799498 RepID=UPI0018F77D21|nr:D-isomer specific 2-hydroxyacid dehydrogenase family protein [Antrihabitans sp. YC2-6]MBJ8346810.1 hydroxyacid dehydrogenase [Antrihabitans sp. YC2-6]